MTSLASLENDTSASALQRFVRRTTPAAQTLERCELCGEAIPREHRHLLEVSSRRVSCVCQACSILFSNKAASAGRQRLIPDRCLVLKNFRMSDAQWEELRIPVGMAFLLWSTPAGQAVAFYPGPAGATESLLPMEVWSALETSNPALAELEPDVEALLVNRARGARQYFLVPIDECYRLVALIRRHWRGLSGGQQVWQEIGQFFEALQTRTSKE
jgi:hypothetical protein